MDEIDLMLDSLQKQETYYAYSVKREDLIRWLEELKTLKAKQTVTVKHVMEGQIFSPKTMRWETIWRGER